jgi:DNA-binding transcriptional LysR family regulator
MDRLRLMEVFVTIADTGALARAARELRMSPAAVTRALAALEERLGTPLVARTTRSLALTAAGTRYLERCRRVLAEVAAADDEALEAARPRGHLTLTTSHTFARRVVAPLVGPFLAEHPDMSAGLVLSDRFVNLVEEGIDVAVRLGTLPDSSLVARRVGRIRRMAVASPAFVARHGAPDHPRALRDLPLVGFTGIVTTHEWRFADDGRPLSVTVSPRFEVNDAEAAVAAAEAGEGATVAVSYLVADRIAAGRLVPLLETYAPPPSPVHIVTPPSRLPSPKVRAFVDYAAPRLAAALEAVERTLAAVSDPSGAPADPPRARAPEDPPSSPDAAAPAGGAPRRSG